MGKNTFFKMILLVVSGVFLYYIIFFLINTNFYNKISTDIFCVIMLIPLYMILIWLLISIAFNLLFKKTVLYELKINAVIISVFFLPVLLLFPYINYYNNLSSVYTSILGNIYIPFIGYVKIDMAKYFFISIIGSLWLIVIYTFSIRFIKHMYKKIENFSEKSLKKIFFIFMLVFYLSVTSYITFIYPPTGDEPHYITAAVSITKDQDFNLSNNYENKQDFIKFYPAYIDDYKNLHTIKSNRNNNYYTTHNIGLSLLFSPFILLNGRYWLQFVMNFITTLLILMTYILLKHFQVSTKNSFLIAALSGICMPIVTHSSLILTEIPAALMISYCLYFLMNSNWRPIQKIVFFVSIGFFPWLHSKFLIFSLTLYIIYYFIVLKDNKFNLKNELLNNIPILLSFFLCVIYYYSIYNLIFPFEINKLHEKVYTTDANLQVNKFDPSPQHFFVSFLAVFFDRDFGLITYCALYIVSFWGIILAFIKKEKKFFIPIIICLPYLILFLLWKDWTGSMAPARQLVPILPLLILFIGYFIDLIKIIKTKILLFLTIFSIFTAWLLNSFPLLRYAMTKDKIYSYLSKIIPEWLFFIIPSFRENVLVSCILSCFFIVMISYLFFYITKNQIKKT